MIEVYKIVSGSVNYGKSMFRISRSGYNLVSMVDRSDKYRKSFFAERVIHYWNALPLNVKVSKSVDAFKCNPSRHINSSYNVTGNY